MEQDLLLRPQQKKRPLPADVASGAAGPASPAPPGRWEREQQNRVGEKRLRILQIVDGFRMGGAETKLLELIAHLDKQRFEIVLANVGPTGPLEHKFQQLGIDIFQYQRRSAFDPLPVWRLYRLMRQREIDIVQTTLLWADIIGALAAKLAGVPAIFSWETVSHEGDPFHNNFQRRAGYRLAMKWVDRIIPVSHEIKRSLIKRRNIPADKIHVIHYGVDLEKYRPADRQAVLAKRRELGISSDAILIGVLARLEPPKGHRFFIEAFPAIVKQFPLARAVFAGEGSLRGELEAQVRALGMSDCISFLGARNDVNEILGALDLFVLPSVSEGLPNVVLEAMAAQKPVLATAVGGIPEVVSHGENGYLAPPADVTGLQSLLLQCLNERERWPSLAQQGRHTVETEFSLAHQVSSFERIFTNVYGAKMRTAQLT